MKSKNSCAVVRYYFPQISVIYVSFQCYYAEL